MYTHPQTKRQRNGSTDMDTVPRKIGIRRVIPCRFPRLSLMRRPEQIQHYLHRVESIQRNLDKTRIPVTHRTIPQARKLESLEITALVTLGTHETGILIHEIQKIELVTLVIPDTADKIHRIEMSSTLQDITGTLIIHIDLDTLQNLKIGRTILAGNNERTAARLTLVADHTTDTDRTI